MDTALLPIPTMAELVGAIPFSRRIYDPRCQASLIRYNENYFPSPIQSVQPERGERIRMTVKQARTMARSWTAGYLVDAGPSAYSLSLSKEEVGLLYEKDKDIAFARFFWVFSTSSKIHRLFRMCRSKVGRYL